LYSIYTSAALVLNTAGSISTRSDASTTGADEVLFVVAQARQTISRIISIVRAYLTADISAETLVSTSVRPPIRVVFIV
jgi:hypothetical protein